MKGMIFLIWASKSSSFDLKLLVWGLVQYLASMIRALQKDELMEASSIGNVWVWGRCTDLYCVCICVFVFLFVFVYLCICALFIRAVLLWGKRASPSNADLYWLYLNPPLSTPGSDFVGCTLIHVLLYGLYPTQPLRFCCTDPCLYQTPPTTCPIWFYCFLFYCIVRI